MSCEHNLRNGWDYHFNQTPQQRNDTAQRAAFLLYQDYPDNRVQGGGQLVISALGKVGAFFKIHQPPQVIQRHAAIQADLRGGGTSHFGIVTQSLSDTKNSMG